MYHSLFIRSSVNGQLVCFHVLAIVNSALMNFGVHVSFSLMVSSGYIPGSGSVGSYSNFIPIFLKESPYCSPYQFVFPPTVQEASLFSTPSPAFIVCIFFDGGHSDQHKHSISRSNGLKNYVASEWWAWNWTQVVWLWHLCSSALTCLQNRLSFW